VRLPVFKNTKFRELKFCLSFLFSYVFHNFYCISSCYLSLTKPDIRHFYTDTCLDMVIQWLKLALSSGPNRVGVPCLVPEGRNIQFPKPCVSKCWTLNKVKENNNPKCYAPSSEHFNIRKYFRILKFRVFCDEAPCSHVKVDRGFRGVYCLHHQGQ
jgi:hypothetical protein